MNKALNILHASCKESFCLGEAMGKMPDFPASCQWVWHPELEAGEPGYVIFERKVEVKEPATFQLWYSADNRCNLRLDGAVIARGPGKSDLEHYYCAPVSGELTAGTHIFRAEIVVWRTNFRNQPGPWSEIHCGGGWLACGTIVNRNGRELLRLDTPGDWQCQIDFSKKHRSWQEAWEFPWTLPCPPMEECCCEVAPCAEWKKPVAVGNPYWRHQLNSDNNTRWLLVPRPIPPLREQAITTLSIRSCSRADAKLQLDGTGNLSGVIPAGHTVILLDSGEYHTAFCTMQGTGGNGTCEVAWAESLFVNGEKKLRDAIAGQVGRWGYADKLHIGDIAWQWESFWFRSGRWIELRFELNSPMELKKFALTSWHYPFVRRGHLQLSCDSDWQKISDVAWRTVLCCAHETYEDCPYWEQLQYVGDTRLQALISYAVTGDDRLAAQAMEHFANSLTSDGLTQSRYPSNWRQIIPEFSLFWVLMVHDHYRYYADLELVKRYLPRIHIVLDYFERLRREDGLIGPVGFWNITDWVPEWENGKTDRGCGEPETLISLIYAEACRRVAELEAALENESQKVVLGKRYERSIKAVNEHCFCKNVGFYQDVPGREWYSSHVNCWAVLADAVPLDRQVGFVKRVLEEQGAVLTKGTLYFSAYLFETLRKVGIDFQALDEVLKEWKRILEWNFDTFPETPACDTRSDCHAWSATPLAEMITSVLGVTPEQPGFQVIRLKPMELPYQATVGVAPLGKEDELKMEFTTLEHGWQLRLQCRNDHNIHIIWPDGNEQFTVVTGKRDHIFNSEKSNHKK